MNIFKSKYFIDFHESILISIGICFEPRNQFIFSWWILTRLRRRTGMAWTSTKNEGNRASVSVEKKTTTTTDCISTAFSWRWHSWHLLIRKFIVSRYPSRYGLYLKDKPNTTVVPLEYEPEDKPIKSGKA